MKKLLVLLFALSLTVFAMEHGEVKVDSNHAQVAWDSDQKKWVSLEQFWRNYAEQNGGLTWGQSDSYPNYDDVNEYDLFMVELESGLCLMEFYHSRWRRANDVRRWDSAFNEYAGCPDVFK